jgi:polyphosphate kinase 2 (PPK2 family)
MAKSIVLAQVDLDKKLDDEKEYDKKLESAQKRLLLLQSKYIKQGRRAVIVCEGWDASGKGGAIQRMTRVIDPRHYQVWPIGAPDPVEQGKHYLVRFWSKLPAKGSWGFFDRSWYGRVLVERVEGFADKKAWHRAYDEINAFEKMLTDDGVALVKLFFHVSSKEQLERFEDRAKDPFKSWKLTDDDWRNRKKRKQYETATNEMFARTSPKNAPWTVIEGDYKWWARVKAASTVADVLEKGI